MMSVLFIIRVNKRVWHKYVVHDGSLFNVPGNHLESENNNSSINSHSISNLLLSINNCENEDKIETLNIDSFRKCLQSEVGRRGYVSKIKSAPVLITDGYILSVLTKTLIGSTYFRNFFIGNCSNCFQISPKVPGNIFIVKVRLVPAKSEIIDYMWNARLTTLAQERRELENAMYWLSTLGGAFSALGDEFKHCAIMAGRISVGQLWLALRLGDPLTVARCKLFLAISLMQRGQLRTARQLVCQQYVIAKCARETDPRLVRMCQGVWAKLQYAYELRRNTKAEKQ